MGLLSLFFSLLIIKRAFQWVEIDRRGIYSKSLFGLIKFCSWENINNIELAMTLEGSKHTGQYYIIFCNDNVKEKYRLTYNRKYLNIRVTYREETRKLIEEYFNKEIVDLPYEIILKRRKNDRNTSK